MLPKNKYVFLEALIITIFIFWMGILLGVSYEGGKLKTISQYYDKSELFLMDIMALKDSLELNDDCSNLVELTLNFADEIYEEALILEKYESSEKLQDEFRLAHSKYDLLRTLLWINSVKVSELCSKHNFSYVIYLYNLNPEDLVERAKNTVWSKILFDLKINVGSRIVLIPIAVNNNISSLNFMVSQFNITKYPVVIIDNKFVLNELDNSENLLSYLN